MGITALAENGSYGRRYGRHYGRRRAHVTLMWLGDRI